MADAEALWADAAAQQAASHNPKAIRIHDTRLQTTHPSHRWTFTYDVDATTDHSWQKPMTCMRCVHVNADSGKRCKRDTCITLPVCWQHLKSDYKLRVGRTTLRDTNGVRLNFLGLFACDEHAGANAVVFQTGAYIVPYVGEIINPDLLEERYHGNEVAPYVDRIGRNRFVDAGPMRGVGGISNMCAAWLAFKPDGENAMCSNNALIESRGIGPHSFPFLKATKPINNGEEVFTHYGVEYFAEDSIHLKHETRPQKAYIKTEYKCKRR